MKYLRLGQIIRARLNAKSMLQKELGEKIGLKQQTISQYIRGVNEPDLRTLIKIADVLDISLDELITGTRYENKSTRENLALSEKAIENIKFLAQIDFFDELLSDEGFVEVFNKSVRNFEINITAMRNKPEFISNISSGEKISTEDFFASVENTVAIEFFNFFQDFFRRQNWVRQGKNPPKKVKEQLKRAEEIANFFKKIYKNA